MKEKKKTKEQLIKELESLKRLEKELEIKSMILDESENMYRTIFEATGTAAVIVEEDTTISLMNSEAEKLSNYSKEEVEGKKSWIEFVDEEDLERLKGYFLLRRTDPKAAPNNYEFKFVDKIGQRRNVYATVALIPGTKKSVVSILDLTERKKTEEKLRQTSEYLENLFNYANAPIIVWDPDFKITQFNKAFERLTGYKVDEVLGKELSILFPKEGKEESLRKIESTLIGEYWESVEIPILKKNGDVRIALWNSANIYSADGKTLLATIAQGQDITGRKRAEEALRESEAKYRSLFENSKDAVYITSKNGNFIDINPAGAELLGYEREELLKHRNIKNLYVDPSERSKFMSKIEKQGFLKDYPLDLKDKSGRRLNTLVTSAVKMDEEGRTIGYQGFIRDVTEKKQAEEELRKSVAKLEKTVEGTIQAMKVTVEMRDPYTAGHHLRVAKLATAIAKSKGFSQEEIEAINMAATIHDLGKIYVPAEILSKPARLAEIEFNMIKIHPQASHDILENIDFPWPIAKIVLQHHERMDGSGYPLGLRGEDICIESRILGVADVVEAMASFRPYRPPLGVERALQEIAMNSGILYDPGVVEVCIEVFKKGFEFD